MAGTEFFLRISNRTFEHFSGHGYVDAGGSPERIIPLNDLWDLHLSVHERIYDAAGQQIGVRFKDSDGGLHDVYPGKVYGIDSWTTAVDDDGCPEDICISYYVELLPPDAVRFDERPE